MKPILARIDKFFDRHQFECITWVCGLTVISWLVQHPGCVDDPAFCDLAFGLDCFIVALGIGAFLWLCKLKKW